MRSYVIIIGAMKSGTTTLFDLLARHPEIAPAAQKEPGFFAFDGVYSKGFAWFDGLFDFDPAQHRYRLEASTDYTKAPFVDGVWERMTASPDVRVKLIYIMRHPLRRLESHARHVQAKKKEIGQAVSPKEDHSLDAGLSTVNLAIARYATQLDRFAEARRAGHLHCLTLEELKSDPDGSMAALAEFLDLDPAGFGADLPASNKAGTKTQVSSGWEALSRIRPLMRLGQMIVPAPVRAKVHQAVRRPVTVTGRFRFDAMEEETLRGLLDDEMRRLERDYGVDVSGYWGL